MNILSKLPLPQNECFLYTKSPAKNRRAIFLPFKRHYFDIIGNIFEIFYDIIQISLQVKLKEGYCGFSKYNSKCTRLH